MIKMAKILLLKGTLNIDKQRSEVTFTFGEILIISRMKTR